MKSLGFISIFAFALCLASCRSEAKETSKAETKQNKVEINFSADSCYSYIEKQCSFGSRTLESKAHDKCVAFMAGKLREFGAEVEIQKCEVVDWENKKRKAENVIAHLGDSTFQKRVILFSHYDSRSYADKDEDESTRLKPIDGANDGASGVGVILEVARQWKDCNPRYGLDIVFFDAEDLGEPSFLTGKSSDESWCLGSQYWSANTDYSRYRKPVAGILLDMVGDKNARFCVDYVSELYAYDLALDIWKRARSLGYSELFRTDERGAGLIDDHYYVNKLAGIPTIDIIDYYEARGGFPKTWHTHNDVVDNISKTTLEAVGKTIISYIKR